MTPAEPSQKTVVTSQLMAAGGGCTARTTLSSAAELARMTGMDTSTTTTASVSRNASDARRRVVPPPRGPSTVDRSRSSWRVPAAPSLATAVIGFLLSVIRARRAALRNHPPRVMTPTGLSQKIETGLDQGRC
jgi:hypothetical protein